MKDMSFSPSKDLQHPVFKIVSEVAAMESIDVYVIGGYVRDLILHRQSKDIDIMTVGNGIDLAGKVAERLGTTKVQVFKNFGTAMIRYRDLDIEFVGARRESYTPESRKPDIETGTLEDDQKRRDFTINAMAISLNQSTYGELIDPFGGMNDIQDKLLRTPLDPDLTFSDDPLRMMRAVRFASQLKFHIHPETLESITRNRMRMEIVSEERIAEELNKILMSTKPSIGFKLLDDTGLLEIVFPELHALKGIEERKGIRHKDNFYHTIRVLDNICPYTDDLWLRWATLLHDIAKPMTKRFDTEAGWTFHGHNHHGARMVPQIFRRMKLPMNEKMKFVEKMVNLHMRPIVLSQETVTDSAVRRLLFEAGDDIDDLMTLCEADITSGIREKVERYLKNFQLVRQKLTEIEEKDRVRNWQPPISGEEIMQVFGIPPCRSVGDIKNTIKDAILDGLIHNDRVEAWALMIDTGNKLGLTLKPGYENPLPIESNDHEN
jgi:poly(A) polymerase